MRRYDASGKNEYRRKADPRGRFVARYHGERYSRGASSFQTAVSDLDFMSMEEYWRLRHCARRLAPGKSCVVSKSIHLLRIK